MCKDAWISWFFIACRARCGAGAVVPEWLLPLGWPPSERFVPVMPGIALFALLVFSDDVELIRIISPAVFDTAEEPTP